MHERTEVGTDLKKSVGCMVVEVLIVQAIVHFPLCCHALGTNEVALIASGHLVDFFVGLHK